MHTSPVGSLGRFGCVRTAVAALATAVPLVVLGGAAGAQEPGEPLVSGIDVTYSPAAEQGACVPGPGSLAYEPVHDDSTFTLRLTVAAPLCEPIAATAAIYGMPGNGIPWPQDLVEFANFTIDEAGTIDVTFTKTCEPAQFDVLTGATPQTVAPWGEWHGPLLFPYDVDTTYQHWGGQCAAPTTTSTTAPPESAATTTTTTTSVIESSPTTTEPEVLAVTDEQPPPADGPQVLAAGEELDEAPAALAFTGLGFRVLLVAAASLLLAGLAIGALGRQSS